MRIIIAGMLLAFISLANAATDTHPPQLWGSVEYLYGWAQNTPLGVPLVTRNSDPSSLAIINQAGTQIIFGSGSNKNTLNLSGMNGTRIAIGGWLDCSKRVGLEASGFALSDAQGSFQASSIGNQLPAINIPFFDTLTSTENVLVDHHPNTVSVNDRLKPWGIELNGLLNLNDKLNFPLTLTTGIRYLNISEDFTINDAFSLPSQTSVFNVRDEFSTKNNFYGLQAGIRSQYTYCNFIFDANAAIALGENFEKLKINGQLNVNNSIVLQSIGLFAEPSNIGTYGHTQFAIVPELRARIAYQLCPNIRPFIAYNFLYISDVIRPGKQIDRNINKSQNPAFNETGILRGQSAPTAKFNNTSMWIQSISAGLEITF